MMIFRKAIPRRRFLRGMAATLALPLLDGMVPACARAADTTAKPPLRLGIVYVPNGMSPMEKWIPKTPGPLELTPTLEPVAAFKDRLLVLSGLYQKEAMAIPGEGAQDHSRACATFLSGVRIKVTAGKDLRGGISMDQIVAQEVGKQTQLASLELSLCANELVGTCEPDYSCVYLSTFSWRSPTMPLPMEHNPRAVFERLFGDSDSTDREARVALIHNQRSILDRLLTTVASFMNDLGPSDRAKLSEYLDAIRDVERRIEIAEQQASRELPKLDKPLGSIPNTFDEYAKLMIDLQVLAFQTDMTRVISLMMGREGPYGGRSYPEVGVADLHHAISHHMNDPDKIEKCFRINVYHMKMFAYFLEKMQSTPDGDGTLLDHSLILYASGLSNGNIHSHIDLPVMLVCGKESEIKGGRHIRYPQSTPITNLYLTMLDKLGLPGEKFGDSTGELPELLSV